MIFAKEDEERLKKLDISSLLELALAVPQKYEDFSLDKPLTENEFCAIHCEVVSKQQTPKTLTFDLRLLSHGGGLIKAVFFSPKRYQQSVFSIGESLYLYGKISHYPYLCIVHPKKITTIGEINKIYAKGPQNKTHKLLASKYLTLQNLLDEGLDEESAKNILTLHFPLFTAQIYENGRVKKELVDSLKLLEIYNYLKLLFSKKIELPATVVKPESLNDFLRRLPFKPTNDQMAAIEACKIDMQKSVQAKRVVIGDVGCGKTTVILALAQMTGSGKTALLAPTAILANQIYEEAQKYLSLNTLLVTQSSKAKDEEIQKADFLIGTHALLYKKLPICQTLIVDEQHRFGTNQRHLISKLVSDGSIRPHYFQFSATPIPRTQALIEATLADITMIKEMPQEKNIETKIISKEGFKELFAHIKSEIERGFQVALIYPLVEKSDSAAYASLEEAEGFWKKHFDKVFVTHGKDSAKEDVFLEFRNGGELILSTTVMEVGISLPKLSTIVVVGAEKLGLASLHQLRGRVARNTKEGWCFLYTNNMDNERLQKFAVTKSGFEIAELDLQYRDSGNLLTGKEQSGRQFEWFSLKTDEKIAKKAKALLESFLKSGAVK
jgi:ATP-dependent DNA helicase RecG